MKIEELIETASNNNEILQNNLTKYINGVLPPEKSEEKLRLLENLMRYEDIFKEFCNWLLTNEIKKDSNSVKEYDYTAYDILVKEPCLPTHVAYLWLGFLRDNSEKTQEILAILKNGLPAERIIKLHYNISQIRKYLETKGLTDVVINNLTKPYYKHPDIANEFEIWLRTNKFVEENPITECGYTAKKLYDNHKDKLDITGVFAMLRTLRENPEQGLQTIANNFPRK